MGRRGEAAAVAGAPRRRVGTRGRRVHTLASADCPDLACEGPLEPGPVRRQLLDPTIGFEVIEQGWDLALQRQHPLHSSPTTTATVSCTAPTGSTCCATPRSRRRTARRRLSLARSVGLRTSSRRGSKMHPGLAVSRCDPGVDRWARRPAQLNLPIEAGVGDSMFPSASPCRRCPWSSAGRRCRRVPLGDRARASRCGGTSSTRRTASSSSTSRMRREARPHGELLETGDAIVQTLTFS